MNAKPELCRYQEKASEQLVKALVAMLGRDELEDRLVVMKAPTGSGKTLMLADALGKVHAHPHRRDFVVLWLSPGKGKLHLQSARALSRFLEGTLMSVSVLESRSDIVSNPSPAAGSVLVINWEKLFRQEDGEFTNVMLREGETDNFFEMLRNITDAGLDLIAVIDESHINLDGPKTHRLMEELRRHRPFIRIETSATPSAATSAEGREDGRHFDVLVKFADVETEGMVRKTVLLNPDFAEVQVKYPKESLDRQVLNAAWDRLEELKAGYLAEGSPVKPLLLVQYPDGANAVARAQVAEAFLASKGLVKDETYATYLSGEHSDDLESIASYDSPYRALIFKQAIATGWDCPRAQVLVQFRDPRSQTFRIQTLGRLMRSPEQRHYENEDLNAAYVYSDLEGVQVDVVSDEPDYKIRDVVVRRGAQYPPAGLRLRSVFQPRKRELDYPLRSNLEQALQKELNASVQKLLPEEPLESTPTGFLIDATLDVKELLTIGEADFLGTQGEGLLGPELAQALFDELLTFDIGPYRSREQSRSRIKTVLSNWMSKQRPDWEVEHVQHFVLQHLEEVSRAIATACSECAVKEDAQAVATARSKIRVNESWEVPTSELVSEETHELFGNGNLMEPALVELNRSEPEKRFLEWVEVEVEAGRAVWWWKNGERDEKYLGIEYETDDGDVIERTYPDFLVMAADGTLWVLEVKDVNDPDGQVGGVTSAKAVGLFRWASEHNKRRLTDDQLLSSPVVKAGVVVAQREGTGLTARIGNSSRWEAPTKEALLSGRSWEPLQFAGAQEDSAGD